MTRTEFDLIARLLRSNLRGKADGPGTKDAPHHCFRWEDWMTWPGRAISAQLKLDGTGLACRRNIL